MTLKNHGIQGHHWVSFELAGNKSNRLGIGARLTVKAGGMTQTNEIHSGGSYLSQNDFRVHFGLGSPTQIEILEIPLALWAVDTVKELPVDKFYAVLEGTASSVKAGPKASLVAVNRGILEWSNGNLSCGSPEAFVS